MIVWLIYHLKLKGNTEKSSTLIIAQTKQVSFPLETLTLTVFNCLLVLVSPFLPVSCRTTLASKAQCRRVDRNVVSQAPVVAILPTRFFLSNVVASSFKRSPRATVAAFLTVALCRVLSTSFSLDRRESTPAGMPYPSMLCAIGQRTRQGSRWSCHLAFHSVSQDERLLNCLLHWLQLVSNTGHTATEVLPLSLQTKGEANIGRVREASRKFANASTPYPPLLHHCLYPTIQHLV